MGAARAVLQLVTQMLRVLIWYEFLEDIRYHKTNEYPAYEGKASFSLQQVLRARCAVVLIANSREAVNYRDENDLSWYWGLDWRSGL